MNKAHGKNSLHFNLNIVQFPNFAFNYFALGIFGDPNKICRSFQERVTLRLVSEERG